MSGPGREPAAAGAPASRGGAGRQLVLWGVGLGVTALALWLAVRDVNFHDAVEIIGGANWPLLVLVGIPAQVAAMVVRAMRWRHLTDVIQEIRFFPLFRATCIGFMANNLLPARAGEVIRPWVVSRETGASGAGILGTVVVERMIDSMCFLALLSAVVWGGGVRAFDGGAASLAVIGILVTVIVPVSALICLRVAPERSLLLLHRFASEFVPARLEAFRSRLVPVLPERTARWLARISERLVHLSAEVEGLLVRFSKGLDSLRGGKHLFWVVVHSIVLWGVISVVPLYVGMESVGIDLGSPMRMLAASYVGLAAVGLGVAVPSAPGFDGTYHLACKAALEVFGVPDSRAFAMAVVTHATFWATVTLLGLAMLPFGRTGLRAGLEAAASADQDPDADRR